VDIARQIEVMLGSNAGRRNTSGTDGFCQPRAILSLRNMQPRAVGSQSFSGSNTPESEGELAGSPYGSSGFQGRGETFLALVQRLKDVILIIERLPRSLIVLCPTEEILRVLLAHFYGCPAARRPWDMPLPDGPIIELQRDHTGFALRSLPVPCITQIGGA